MQRKLRAFLDAVHGSKWARIIPLCLLAALYVVSMVIWHPAEVSGWLMPLFIDAMAAGGMYFVSRFSSGTWEFKNIGVLFFSVFSALGTLMILTMKPFAFLGEFNPGLGVGPAMFLGISLYHRYRMKKGIYPPERRPAPCFTSAASPSPARSGSPSSSTGHTGSATTPTIPSA